MANRFIAEMPINMTAKYKVPCLITMSGSPGSGKTYVAQQLSKELQIFLLSNDYIRNYFFQLSSEYTEAKRLEIEALVEKINSARLSRVILTRTPFVFDRDFNKVEDFSRFEIIRKIFMYELIKVKINSNDNDNIERIARRVMDYSKRDPSVIGDNVSYSCAYPEEAYYRIKARKPQTIPDNYFDYVINNYGTEQQFNNSIEEVISDIKGKKLIKR